MKLVIDIPEEDYIRLRDEGMFGNVTTFKRAVREGIPLEQEPCEDCISRQAAIDAIQTLIDDILHRFEVTAGVEKRRYMECLQIIRELPSVKPEPYKEDNNGKNNSN